MSVDQLSTRILRGALLWDQFIFGRVLYRNTNDDNREDILDTYDVNGEE